MDFIFLSILISAFLDNLNYNTKNEHNKTSNPRDFELPKCIFLPQPDWFRTVALEGKVKVLVAQLCLTLCNPMDCSPTGSSVHEILQARILEWVAISSSRGSSWPRIWTIISCISYIHWDVLYHWATWEVIMLLLYRYFPNEQKLQHCELGSYFHTHSIIFIR